MKLVKTNDNSYTFHSDKYDETYHSTSGALEESLKKFVEPCGIKDGMNILDIGFGHWNEPRNNSISSNCSWKQ